MVIQCCLCYRVKETADSLKVVGPRRTRPAPDAPTTWKKVRDAAIVSRTARHTFCPDCEHKFRQRWGLLASRKAS